MMIYFNFTEIKGKWLNLMDKISIYQHPRTESLIAFAIVMTGVMLSGMAIASYNLKNAQASIETEKVRLLQRQESNRHTEAVEKIKADLETLRIENELRVAETLAAANPYVVEAKHSVVPINLYVGIGTDAGTEISISMIKINGKTYTPEQRKLMTMAFHIGGEFGYPETIQSLLMQETLAGAWGDRIGDTNLPIGKRSYGVMQMKVATAKKVLKRNDDLIVKYFPSRKTYKRLRDEEIIIKLIQDDEFNIRLASLNFGIHRKASKSWAQAVVAYNTGQGAANGIKYPKKHKYYRHILKRMISEVRPFNTETKLTL